MKYIEIRQDTIANISTAACIMYFIYIYAIEYCNIFQDVSILVKFQVYAINLRT